METGKGARESRLARIREFLPLFQFFLSIFVILVLLSGCASPGEPIARRPPTPAGITDLAAQQSGNNVVLTFTLPRETIDQRPLKEMPTIEIWRNFAASSPTAPAAPRVSPSLLITIPSAMVSNYTEQGRIRYVNALQPDDFTQHPNEIANYTVRTRVSEKKPSPNSNAAALQIYPAPEPIDDLKTEVTRSGVTLAWTSPQRTPVGAAPPIVMFRIYRTEIEIAKPSAGDSQSQPRTPSPLPASSSAKSKQQFAKIAETASSTYQDTQAEFGTTYTYSVRSVVQYSGHDLESSDSNPASITPRDIFPPSAPQGLVVVFVPKLGDTAAHLELSWAINSETDIAGYNVYRSEQDVTLGTRLNSELLLTPAFRDMSASAERQYFYTITAVSRSGNESSPSASATGEIPAESQQQP
jgi:hypothetical protein